MCDRRWIDGVRSGDARAWADLVHANYDRIYRLLANLTRDRHAAEDLCQETFAAAWSKIGSFAGDCAVGTWLHRIAYRKFLDARRARKPPVSPPAFPSSTSSPDPLAGLVMDEETRAAHEAMARMDEPERVVIVLHYLNGLSYREMSAVTGEPVGTMKWRTRVALQRLSALLRTTETSDEQARNQRTDPPAAGDAVTADPAPA